MHIEVIDNPARWRFEAEIDGMLARADYEINGNVITFTHTVVPPQHQGQGIGEALARFGLDTARSRGLKVVPQCPFIASFIDEHPEYADLLA